jgi:uncharacterized membrane protein
MNTSAILVFTGLISISALAHFLPQFTRPDVFFAVTVDPAFRTTVSARRIIRDYRIALWCSAIAAGIFFSVLHRAGAAFIIDVVGNCVARVVSRRRTLIHATTHATPIEVDLSAPKERLPGGLLAALLPFVALVSVGLWAVPHMDRLPNRVPVRWGLYGPNRWVMTSPRAIIGLLAVHALICLWLAASAWGVLHWSRRVCASGPAAAAERQFRRRTVLSMLTAEYFTILPPVFGLLQAPALAMQVWSVALLLTVLSFVISLMRAGQGGTRLSAAVQAPIGDRTADARWIGGLIYFNPTDPALFVEKRMGVGWSLNFGNPWSWAPLMAVAGIVVLGLLLVQRVPDSAIGGPLQPEDRGAVQSNEPAGPGTEDSLRRYILSLQRGRPDYDEMSPRLAAAVNRQLPGIMATIDGLGEFNSLTYEGTDSSGSAVYMAAFARGRLEWHVGPLVDGKVTSRNFRPLP